MDQGLEQNEPVLLLSMVKEKEKLHGL